MKVAVTVAVLAVGGTAVAAETGSLPRAAQHHAHRLFSGLGVPPPVTTPVSAAPSRSAEGRPSPSAGASSASGAPVPSGSAPVEPDARALCREWQAAGDKKDGEPMAAESRARLTTLAGGKEAKIARFCAPLLAGPAEPTPTPPAPSDPPKPGNGNGNGPGNGNSPGNGNDPGKSKEPKGAVAATPLMTAGQPG